MIDKEQNYTTIYIVRHGETDWNVNRLIQSHIDTLLNETGEKQAFGLAKELQEIMFTQFFPPIYLGPLERQK